MMLEVGGKVLMAKGSGSNTKVKGDLDESNDVVGSEKAQFAQGGCAVAYGKDHFKGIEGSIEDFDRGLKDLRGEMLSARKEVIYTQRQGRDEFQIKVPQAIDRPTKVWKKF